MFIVLKILKPPVGVAVPTGGFCVHYFKFKKWDRSLF